MVNRAARLGLGAVVGLAACAGLLLGGFVLIALVMWLRLPPLSLAVILPAYGVTLVWANAKFGGPF